MLPACVDVPVTQWSDEWIANHASSYLDDPPSRRGALEASLTNPDNLYSQVRLAAYGRIERGWDTLPEWFPRSAPIDDQLADAIARGESIALPERSPIWDRTTRPSTFAAWAALGRRVFFELPLRAEPMFETALSNPELGETLGVVRAADGTRPGLVLLRDLDGTDRVGITCAVCHAAIENGQVIAGRARRSLDYGALRIAFADANGIELDADTRARLESWGPGRADVLEELSEVPIAIPDLWGLREQTLLTQGGTLRQDTPLALAIRQETQYIQANHMASRPPRELAFALAVFLYSLDPPAPRPSGVSDEALIAGEQVFSRECARCHSNAAYGGEWVDVAIVGTDPELALGTARGTGGYRPPSLLRVADAAPYLHHGAIPSLEAMFSPERTIGGHLFGQGLPSEERQALIAWLSTR